MTFDRCPDSLVNKDICGLIRDLGLTKANAELFASRFKQLNLMGKSVKVAYQGKHH